MRLRRAELRGRVKADLALRFSRSGLTSFAGLELVRRYFCQLGLVEKIRRHIGSSVPASDYGVVGLIMVVLTLLNDPIASGGVRRLRLRAGRHGSPKAVTLGLRGQGEALPNLTLPVPDAVDTVTVQLLNSDNSTCWGDTFLRPFAVNRDGSTATFKAVRR